MQIVPTKPLLTVCHNTVMLMLDMIFQLRLLWLLLLFSAVGREQLFRNTAWNHLLNACTIVHLILPMIEIQRCLPCMAMEKLPHSPEANALHIGM